MDLRKLDLNRLSADVNIDGVGPVRIEWWKGEEEHPGKFVIEGVSTCQAMKVLLDCLVPPAAFPIPNAISPSGITTTTLPTKSVADAIREATKAEAKEDAKAYRPKEPPAFDAMALEKASGSTHGVKVTPPGGQNQDYTVFATMDRMQDVIKELVKRGFDTYDKVKVEAKAIQDAGASPLLTRLAEALDDRILAASTTLKLPGTAGV